MQHMWELQHALDGPVHWTIYTNLKPQSSKVDTHCKLPLASVVIYKWNTPCNYDLYITYTYKLAVILMLKIYRCVCTLQSVPTVYTCATVCSGRHSRFLQLCNAHHYYLVCIEHVSHIIQSEYKYHSSP